MKKIILFEVVLIMLLSGLKIDAAAGSIVNGSFEDDKWITDISVIDPNGWDANIPDNFFGFVSDGWATDGSFSLTLSSSWYVDFDVNDMATVSQMVSLKDVKRVLFDISLYTYGAETTWDTSRRSASVLLDGVPVWSSDIFGPDAYGDHLGQVIDVNVTDSNLHELSLALISKVQEDWLNVYTIYYADWDYVALNCRGLGVIEGDINNDCFVDFSDYALLAKYWLAEVEPDIKFNLSHVGDVNSSYGIINFRDVAVFADGWTGYDANQLESICYFWLQEVLPDDPNNLFKGDDVGIHGVIDWFDLDVFVQDWLKGSYD